MTDDPLRRGSRERGSPTRDSATGRVYSSRNEAYRALAPQYGLDPDDQHGWYSLCRRFPGRFVDVRTGRPIDARGRERKHDARGYWETDVQVGPQGRLVIPAGIRKSMGLSPGDRLSIRVEGGRLVLEKREHILDRIRSRFGKVPESVSLVDELLAERRAEARREQGG